MKLKLSTLALALLTVSVYAANSSTPAAADTSTRKASSATAAQTTPPASTSSVAPSAQAEPTPPLNKYGAVDANAKVPLSVQVPGAPANFVPPSFTPEATAWTGTVVAPPSLNVSSYILVSANNGKILAASNANTRLAPASLTKLMILYITEKQLAQGVIHLNDIVTVSQVAWATGGSRMFLKPHQKVTVQDLISGIIVDSGNDAAVTLATYLGGTQTAFVGMMNQEAKALGMTNTHFTDVMGLPAPSHYSSAYDMALLAQAIVSQYPQYFSWFSQKSFSYNGIKQANFNKLLFIYRYAQGMKTGSTSQAGFSLVSAAQMPNNPLQLIAVVMNAKNGMSSATNSKALLSWGFRSFSAQLIYKTNDVVGNVPVAGGNPDSVPVTVSQDLYATIPSSVAGADKLKADLQLNKDLRAPISKGAVVGTIVVTANGQTVAQVPAVAAKDVSKANWIQRIKNWF